MAHHNRLKAGFVLFGLMSLVFTINLFHLQPIDASRSSKRIIFPGSAPVETSGIRHAPEKLQRATSADRAPAAAEISNVNGMGNLAGRVKRELAAKGYAVGDKGAQDDMVTRAAIMAYEWDNGQALTGRPTEALLQRLILGRGATGGVPGASIAIRPTPEAEDVIRTVQQSLTLLKAGHLETDGRIGNKTIRAIRKFEARQGLPQTGRISGALVASLLKLAEEGRLKDFR